MPNLFSRKPIAELVSEGDNPNALKRALGAGDLIMLAIGAVIGAGIFGSIGSAAAGQIGPNGEIIRVGAGPALVLSFLLLGACCGLAGLCYAELAAMIPQAGSAYAYSYATLGELVAWIIGWDLILEYAVGNVAVAISWGDYFKSLVGDWIHIPDWLTTGYRTALLSSDPKVHGLLASAPHIGNIPILINVPAFSIVMLITWLLLLGVRESARANNIMVAVKLIVLALFIVIGLGHITPANYHPFAPNGFRGIHQGAAIVFFAYIGFDAISTAAEETKNPQRNLPIGILGGLAICTVIYIVIGAVLTGMVPSKDLGAAADPLAYALKATGMTSIAKIVSLGAIFSMAAVLLVFQYGQPRIFFAMARDGLLPALGRQVERQVARAVRDDDRDRRLRRALVAHRRRRRDVRPHQHRDAVRVRAGEHRRDRLAVHRSGSAPTVPRAFRARRWPGRRRSLRIRDAGFAEPGVGPIRLVAGDRARAVFRVRVHALHAAPRDGADRAGEARLRA